MEKTCKPSEHRFGGFLEPQTNTFCVKCGMHRDWANADWRAENLSRTNKQ